MTRQAISTLILSLLLAGCTNAGSVSTNTETTAEKNTATTATTADKPNVSTTVPADFPLPVYPGAKVISVDPGSKVNSGATVVTVFTQVEPSKDAPATIGQFYTQKLQGSGWQVDEPSKLAEMEGASGAYVSARRGNESMSVSISDHTNWDPKVTDIQMQKYINPAGQ